MKKDPKATANAAAITIGVLYISCRVLVQAFPELSLNITRSWFHLIDVSKSVMDLSTESFVLGLVSSVITAWLVGYLFAISYNMFAKGKR